MQNSIHPQPQVAGALATDGAAPAVAASPPARSFGTGFAAGGGEAISPFFSNEFITEKGL